MSLCTLNYACIRVFLLQSYVVVGCSLEGLEMCFVLSVFFRDLCSSPNWHVSDSLVCPKHVLYPFLLWNLSHIISYEGFNKAVERPL